MICLEALCSLFSPEDWLQRTLMPYWLVELVFLNRYQGMGPSGIIAQVAQCEESTCQCRRLKFSPWSRKIPCRKKWQPTLVFFPGKSHGQRSLVGYCP